jgi:hypothetical protein
MALLLIRYMANSLRRLLLEAGRNKLNFISWRVKSKTRASPKRRQVQNARQVQNRGAL